MKRILLPLIGLILVAACFVLFFRADSRIKALEGKLAEIEKRVSALEEIVLPPKKVEQKEAYDFPIEGSHIYGKTDAPITVMMFTNLQCGYCARADKSLREIIKSDADIRLVEKNFPFMARSKPAIKAAFAAGEQGESHFWDFVTKAYEGQRDLSDANFTKWASELKLDVKKFENDLKTNDAKYETALSKDMELVKKAEINYTPFILVNGWKYEGDLTAAAIKEFAASKKKN